MLQINKTWVYVFTRIDIPVSQIAVQSAHAALEAGIKFDKPLHPEPSSLIILAFKNKQKLEKALEYVKNTGIRSIEFHESSWNYGLTSFATEPVSEEQKLLFKKYQLWHGNSLENIPSKINSEDAC